MKLKRTFAWIFMVQAAVDMVASTILSITIVILSILSKLSPFQWMYILFLPIAIFLAIMRFVILKHYLKLTKEVIR